MRTFIKWQGNKSKYKNILMSHVPSDFQRYIEPFVGSGALFLHLAPTKWIINDKNKDLFRVWELVRDDPDFIFLKFRSFKKHFCPKSKEKKLEYCRKITCSLNGCHREEEDREQVVRFLLMVHCSYMGSILYRDKYYFQGLEQQIFCNNKCLFLDPSYQENVREVSRFLNASRGKILNRDYKQVLKQAKTGDFVFLDPPYIEEREYKFQYNHGEILGEAFLDELLREVEQLDDCGVRWMMTQADTPKVRDLFSAYTIVEFPVFRVGSQKRKQELLLKNF